MDNLPPIGDIGELIESEISTTSECAICGTFPTVNWYDAYRVQRHGWRHIWYDRILRKPHYIISGTVEVEFCDDWEPTEEQLLSQEKMRKRMGLDD